MAVPRPVPYELPVLMLDAAQVRAQLAEDQQLARAPSTPLAKALDRALLRQGALEFEPDSPRAPAPSMASLRPRIERELGSAGLRALRAFATERFMRALATRLDDVEEEHGVVGAQYSLFLQHGYLAPDGSLLAPVLSLRATYKVRCNMVFGLAPDAGLSRIERLAYEGYRALEARNLPDEVRTEALQQLLRLAPDDARFQQAWLIWQARAGSVGPLQQYLGTAEGQAASLRLRNMARVRPFAAADTVL